MQCAKEFLLGRDKALTCDSRKLLMCLSVLDKAFLHIFHIIVSCQFFFSALKVRELSYSHHVLAFVCF